MSNYSQRISLSLRASCFVNGSITSPFRPRRSLIKRADIAEINAGDECTPGNYGGSCRSGGNITGEMTEWSEKIDEKKKEKKRDVV